MAVKSRGPNTADVTMAAISAWSLTVESKRFRSGAHLLEDLEASTLDLTGNPEQLWKDKVLP